MRGTKGREPMAVGSSDILRRASRLAPVRSDERFDVLVAGGGASGLMAAVSAARQGAHVLVVETSGCFGGAGTTAMVAQWLGFYNGETCAVGGLPMEFAERVIARGGSKGFENYVLAESTARPLRLKRLPFNPEVAKLVADELVLESGASALVHARIAGASREGDRVSAVQIETSGGRLEVQANCFVDASGDAVVARGAGAPLKGAAPGEHRMGMSLVFRLSHVDIARFRSLTRQEKRAIALEGIAAGELFWDVLSVSPVGESDAICLMSHLDGLDSLDPNDLTKAEFIGRYQVGRISGFLKRRMPGFAACELAGIANQIGVRESVRLVGDYCLTEQDVVEARPFADSIALGCGPLDIHEEDGKLRLLMPSQPFEIPLRAMTCAEAKNLIVTGRAISASREANGAIRHQATAMALGQAAGHLAAYARHYGSDVRAVPPRVVRDSLAAAGALPSRNHLPAQPRQPNKSPIETDTMDHLQFDRRTCLPVRAATLAETFPVRAETAAASQTFILIHGAWFGGWCWANVAAYLRGRGHRVFTPSLTGLGDRAHHAGPSVTLSTHVADIVDVAESEELKGAILVAHSYSGVPCAMAAERIGDRIQRLVFLDSVLPEDGKPLSSLSDPKLWDARAAAAQATPANGFPPPPIGALGISDPDQAAWLERQLRPQPIGTYVEAPKLMKPVGAGIDTVYVSCEGPAMAAINPYRAHAKARTDWQFQCLASSHACMISDPQLTGEMLSRVSE